MCTCLNNLVAHKISNNKHKEKTHMSVKDVVYSASILYKSSTLRHSGEGRGRRKQGKSIQKRSER